jgi:hypothetical protein
MSAPGTDWGSDSNTSLVVDVKVDHGDSQQIVLFAGAEPFSYQGFVGKITTGTHCVTVALARAISHAALNAPAVDVYSISLFEVLPTSPVYMLETHAPVLYGRSVSAKGDTPLLTYGQSKPDKDGVDSDLSYTVIWTHEDMGDGSVPPYQWGRWGRMSDIETVLTEKVAPSGVVVSANYLSCGCEGDPDYPDSAIDRSTGGGETYKPYPLGGGAPGLDDHVAVRDASANNDVSPKGTTRYRFQQSLVAPPKPDEAREVAMDTNPWTYRISGEEVSREAASSTDPRSFDAGVYPQYLIVDIASNPVGTFSVAVEVRIAGDSTWYSNDYAQLTAPSPPVTYPFYNGGHGRTVVKLPPGWNGKTITALRLRLNAPAGTVPSLEGTPTIYLVEVTPSFSIEHPTFPDPTVVPGTKLYPPASTP